MQNAERTVLDQLKTVPYFAGLDRATLELLAGLATRHEYAPGAIIFLEGEANTGLFCVATGWVKVVKYSQDGREQVLRYFSAGDVFGEIAIFQDRSNPATAVALEHCVLWHLPRTALRPLLVAHPAMLLQIMANMADRIVYLAEMVAELSLHTVEVRLARLILDSAPDGALQRYAWLTQAELAARMGTVPDVLNRALRALADAGLIRVDRRQITILDRPGLTQRALLDH